jgi:hypothetical protein
MTVHGHYYQQFDADLSLDVPGEGYGGWKTHDFPIDPERTAVVSMHVWDAGTPEQYPGWFRCVEYLPRSYGIVRTVFPKLFSAVRESGFKLFHVTASHEYARKFPGYRFAQAHALPKRPTPVRIPADPVWDSYDTFKAENTFVGKHNRPDVDRGWPKLDFPPEARPVGDEPVCEDTEQLAGVCLKLGVNHLIYCGFAINWCLFHSPGGMLGMQEHGVFCSAFRDAVTAVENKESARKQLNKEYALWRVAMAHGFVFDTDDFIAALPRPRK